MGGYFYILPVVFQLIFSSVLVHDLRRLAELGLPNTNVLITLSP